MDRTGDQPQRSPAPKEGRRRLLAGSRDRAARSGIFCLALRALKSKGEAFLWPRGLGCASLAHVLATHGEQRVACPCWPCLFTHRLEGCECFRGHFHVEPTHILTGEVRVETEPSESSPAGFCVLGRAQLQEAAREGLRPASLPPPGCRPRWPEGGTGPSQLPACRQCLLVP